MEAPPSILCASRSAPLVMALHDACFSLDFDDNLEMLAGTYCERNDEPRMVSPKQREGHSGAAGLVFNHSFDIGHHQYY
jgi:hypothetical protein